MTRSIVRIFTALLFVLVIFSCKKINESIQREIVVSPEPALFTIPVIPNTNAGFIAGEFLDTINLEHELHLVSKEFGPGNVSDVKVLSVKLDLLADTIDEEHNLALFDDISITVSSGEKKAILAKVENSSASEGSMLVQGAVPTTDLKDILTGSTFLYDIRVRAARATSSTLRARLSPVFSVTVKK